MMAVLVAPSFQFGASLHVAAFAVIGHLAVWYAGQGRWREPSGRVWVCVVFAAITAISLLGTVYREE